MRSRCFAIGFAGVLLTAAAAEAQWFGPAWDINIQLTAQDRAIIRDTVQREIHGRRADTVSSWTNPASGHSGTITLLRRFARQGMACEEIEYRIMTAQPMERPERFVFNSCRLPNGSWKLVG